MNEFIFARDACTGELYFNRYKGFLFCVGEGQGIIANKWRDKTFISCEGIVNLFSTPLEIVT